MRYAPYVLISAHINQRPLVTIGPAVAAGVGRDWAGRSSSRRPFRHGASHAWHRAFSLPGQSQPSCDCALQPVSCRSSSAIPRRKAPVCSPKAPMPFSGAGRLPGAWSWSAPSCPAASPWATGRHTMPAPPRSRNGRCRRLPRQASRRWLRLSPAPAWGYAPLGVPPGPCPSRLLRPPWVPALQEDKAPLPLSAPRCRRLPAPGGPALGGCQAPRRPSARQQRQSPLSRGSSDGCQCGRPPQAPSAHRTPWAWAGRASLGPPRRPKAVRGRGPQTGAGRGSCCTHGQSPMRPLPYGMGVAVPRALPGPSVCGLDGPGQACRGLCDGRCVAGTRLQASPVHTGSPGHGPRRHGPQPCTHASCHREKQRRHAAGPANGQHHLSQAAQGPDVGFISASDRSILQSCKALPVLLPIAAR